MRLCTKITNNVIFVDAFLVGLYLYAYLHVPLSEAVRDSLFEAADAGGCQCDFSEGSQRDLFLEASEIILEAASEIVLKAASEIVLEAVSEIVLETANENVQQAASEIVLEAVSEMVLEGSQ